MYVAIESVIYCGLRVRVGVITDLRFAYRYSKSTEYGNTYTIHDVGSVRAATQLRRAVPGTESGLLVAYDVTGDGTSYNDILRRPPLTRSSSAQSVESESS